MCAVVGNADCCYGGIPLLGGRKEKTYRGWPRGWLLERFVFRVLAYRLACWRPCGLKPHGSVVRWVRANISISLESLSRLLLFSLTSVSSIVYSHLSGRGQSCVGMGSISEELDMATNLSCIARSLATCFVVVLAVGLPSPLRAQCTLNEESLFSLADANGSFSNEGHFDLGGDLLAVVDGLAEQVQVYRFQGGAWTLETVLDVPGVVVGLQTLAEGVAVDTSMGDSIVVLAVEDDPSCETCAGDPAIPSCGCGVMHVFSNSGGSWETEAVITRPGRFEDVAIDGDRIAATVRNRLGLGPNVPGIYVFDLIDGTWTETATMNCQDPQEFVFGNFPIALDGDVIVFGDGTFCFQDLSQQGQIASARLGCFSNFAGVFRLSGGVWFQEALESPLGFCAGVDVDVLGNRIVAIDEHNPTIEGAYVSEYDAGTGSWATEKITFPELFTFNFNTIPSIALSSTGQFAFGVAARSFDQRTGDVLLYSKTDAGWVYSADYAPSSAAIDGGFGSQVVFRGRDLITPGWDDVYTLPAQDCDVDALPDACPAGCIDAFACADCDGNGIPNGCEFDCDGDGVPNNCACEIADAPTQANDLPPMNRYLAFDPPPSCPAAAVRVTLDSLHRPVPPNLDCCPAPDYAMLEAGPSCVEGPDGCVRWLGPPTEYVLNSVTGEMFFVSMLQCEPFYYDWSTVDRIFITGAEVVPSSTYTVELLDEGCDETDALMYSEPLVVTTARWGDVGLPFQDPAAELTQPNVFDVTQFVDAVKLLPAAPSKPQAQLRPSVPDPGLNASVFEITLAVDAVKGSAYPFDAPAACP